jgi:hypothetical protein
LNGVFPRGALGPLAAKQGPLNPLIWLSVASLSFLPAAYFFKGNWMVYPLGLLPFAAFSSTLGVGFYWALKKTHLLQSEEFKILDKLLESSFQTKTGFVDQASLQPVANPKPSPPENRGE